MPTESPLYDLMLLLSNDAEEERRAKIVDDVRQAISSGGGSIAHDDDWGTRALAYRIAHQGDAEYHLLQFTGPPALLDSLGVGEWILGDAPGDPWHPGRSALVLVAGRAIGVVGELQPRAAERFDAVGRVAAFELDVGQLSEHASRARAVRASFKNATARDFWSFVS